MAAARTTTASPVMIALRIERHRLRLIPLDRNV
jgi:hypothetical protein